MKELKPIQAGSQPAAEEPLAGADLRAISDEITHEFPLIGGQSGVVLMDVDPHRLHAYWNLPPETLQQARADFSAAGHKSHLVLRFRELPSQELEVRHDGTVSLEAFDRELRDVQGHVEVEVRGAGERYEAELGLTADDGGWKSMIRSNPVRMPPAGPSSELGMATLNVAAAMPPADVTEASEKPLAADTADGLPMADDPSLRGGPADVLDPVFPNPAPPERAPGGEFAAAQQVEPKVPPAPDSHFEPAGLPGLSAAVQHFSSAALSSSSLSSSALGELEIHAELHVYGRARPGRELYLFGRRIALAPDGTFDVRRVLDPESLLLPLLMTGVEIPPGNP